MKKAMIKNSRGDDSFYRLFSYLSARFTEKIQSMTQIRDVVYLVDTNKASYIIKGYSSHNKLRLQQTFTRTIRTEGFKKTYAYVQHLSQHLLYHEGTYYGCIEYLKPHTTTFTFSTHRNRQEGLKLLKEFHGVTSIVTPRYKTLLSTHDILGKWQERFEIFQRNIPVLQYFIGQEELQEMLEWANWSLTGMAQKEGFFKEEPHVILHGDVAHHNFLRDEAGVLHLIDFDLITIGPECLDFLQYANRILPFLDWSLPSLGRYREMQRFIVQPAFLYGLAFPADIFREWNRVIREKTYTKTQRLQYVRELTLGQFQQRKDFVQELKSAVH